MVIDVQAGIWPQQFSTYWQSAASGCHFLIVHVYTYPVPHHPFFGLPLGRLPPGSPKLITFKSDQSHILLCAIPILIFFILRLLLYYYLNVSHLSTMILLLMSVL